MSELTWLPEAAVINRAPSHTEAAYDMRTFKHIVKWAAREVTELRPQAIVGNGHSGLPVGGAVSYLTGVPLFAVRKESERTVAGNGDPVTGYTRHGVVSRWVWIDDLFSTGGTMLRASREIIMAGLVERQAILPVMALLYKGVGQDGFSRDISTHKWDLYYPDYEGPYDIPVRYWRNTTEGKAHYG